jgi:hypothetical protein
MASVKKFEGKVEEYQGNKLDKPVAYSGEAVQFDSIEEVKTAGKWPNDADILSMVNKQMFTAAKAKAYQQATSDLKTAYENSPEFKRKQFIAAVLALGKTQAEAEAFADSMIG